MLLCDDTVHLQCRKQMTSKAAQNGVVAVMELPVVLLRKNDNHFHQSSMGFGTQHYDNGSDVKTC